MAKRKIVIPFHRGQKVFIGNPLEEDSILDYNCHAIVEEATENLYHPMYSLIAIDKNSKIIGGGAWYPHEILTLVEEVTKQNLKILQQEDEEESE